MKQLRTLLTISVLAVLAFLPAAAQMHKVQKPEDVTRAVGVYEWTGDMAKPAASRLIPVSLFINGKLQDAAVYMARPVPFAIDTGVSYELEKAGVPQGLLNIAFAKHLVASGTTYTNYDDGWFGYGKFAPLPQPKKTTLQASNTPIKLNGMNDVDDDRPHFSDRSAAPGSGSSAQGVPEPSKTGSNPADDPDRPTMKRHSSDTASTSGVPDDDADRPTLRKHSSDSKSSGDQPSVTPVATSLNDDPNRPKLQRGRPAGSTTGLAENDLPKLSGLPGDADLHQMIAVSDAKDRPPHNFGRDWQDDEERNTIQQKLEAVAREQLTKYEAAQDQGTGPSTTAPKFAHSSGSRTRRTTTAAKAAAPAAEPEKLLDEDLRGYELSYGASPTFVFHAHTDGLGPTLRYVTIIAQQNMQGEPEIVLKNVTDAQHLDQTPRMRLVDAVDAEASNRASLLFELRAQNSRQFALYRVLGGRADQIFITGSTQ